MTTSGSINYSLNRNEIINEAFDQIGVRATGQTMSADDISAANTTLNLMIKSWGATGPRLWTTQEATLFLEGDEYKYQLGGTSSNHCTNSYDYTELAADHAIAAVSLTVDSTAGMTAGDYIGITISDGSVDWTTISSVDSATTLTIAAGLSAAADDEAIVWFYTTKIDRPLRIIQLWRRDTSDIDTPMIQVGRQEYDNQPNKTIGAIPVQWYYDPQLSAGYLYLWPTPTADDETIRVVFKYQRVIEDFDAATDDPDIPQEWGEAIIYGLAARLARKYGCSRDIINDMTGLAAGSKQAMEDFDQETTSIFMQPDFGN